MRNIGILKDRQTMNENASPPPSCPSEYEKDALCQIHEWKNPKQNWFDRAMSLAGRPFDKAAQVLFDTRAIGPAIKKAFSGILEIIKNASLWSVRPATILDEYQRMGNTEVLTLPDIFRLDLSAVDRAIGWLDTKYEGIA